MAEELPNLDADNNEDILQNSLVSNSISLTNNRLLIIAGIIGVVVLIGSVIFFTRNQTPKPQQSMSNSSVMIAENSQASDKKKKRIKYERLYNQLESGDASRMLKELSIANINFTTEQSGRNISILIDSDQIEDARNLLALKGLPAGTAKQGYDLLDDAQTLGVTEFDKRVRFLRALSGELEKAINQIDIIESSKVQIVQPEQRLFTVTQPPVTASILIRIIKGASINDDITYSIIQLVANSVENLQLENVSVVDTDGNLLSENIFERIAARRAGTYVEEKTEEQLRDASISREEAIGYPIIPNYDQIQEWFDIKYQFEQDMAEKTERQLLGVLPLASFKVAVTSDIGPLENGNVVDIKRQTISIVIDGLNDDIFLDQVTKRQIFNTVAGTVGYLSGRDNIQLSVAEFALFTEEEKNELRKKYSKTSYFSYAFMGILSILGLGISFFILRAVNAWARRFIRQQNQQVQPTTSTSTDDTLSFNQFQVFDNDSQIRQFKSLSQTNPEIVARVMTAFIEEDLDETESDLTESELVESDT